DVRKHTKGDPQVLLWAAGGRELIAIAPTAPYSSKHILLRWDAATGGFLKQLEAPFSFSSSDQFALVDQGQTLVALVDITAVKKSPTRTKQLVRIRLANGGQSKGLIAEGVGNWALSADGRRLAFEVPGPQPQMKQCVIIDAATQAVVL